MPAISQDPLLIRRLIFLLLAVIVVGTLLLPLGTPPMVVNQESQDFYDAVAALKPGDPILISFDFDPASKPELEPAARALLRQAFRRRLRVVTLGLWQTGIGLAAEAIEAEAEIARSRFPQEGENAYPQYGKDYVFLGWQPGQFALIVRLTEGIQGAFPREFRGAETERLPIWNGSNGEKVRTLGDFPLVVTISAGNPGIDEWIRYGRGKEDFPIATAVTAVTSPGRMPFYKSGQIIGLLAGMRGAAEYEYLLNRSEDPEKFGVTPPPLVAALQGMNALSASHFLIIGLVVVSNIMYFTSQRRGRR